ncbi:MAG: hypothetical protein ACK47B_20345 [Armatimonadota bacterium]
MQLASLETFHDWCADSPIQAENREWSEGHFSLELTSRSGTTESREWSTPYETKTLLAFVTALLDTLSPFDYCWVLKREGKWWDQGENEGLEPVLRSLGIPADFEGALRFTADERPALTLLVTAQIAFGWSGYYDLWVVPDHGRALLRTDDDDFTTLYFTDPTPIEPVVQQMASAGFEPSTDHAAADA